MRRFPVESLQVFVAGIFQAAGALPEHAETTARRLLEGDLRGRTGHGLMRVRPFAQRVAAGGTNPRPEIRLVHETPVSALVDGDHGLGPVVMTRAAETAISKARLSGMAWVGTRRSNHAGAAGIYPAMALREGLVGLFFAAAGYNTVPPWGGIEPLLGTNPMAVAIPAGDETPFQLDIATTVTSHGSIRARALAGESLPEGWVADPAGNPITDPAKVGEGFLLPIGGHKGAGLTVMIGLLAAVMTGGAFGRDVIDPRSQHLPTNTGQAMLVARPDLFRPAEDVRADMDRHLRDLRSSTSATDEPVRLPGEMAVATEEEQRRLGIPVPPSLVEDLHRLADELGSPDRLA